MLSSIINSRISILLFISCLIISCFYGGVFQVDAFASHMTESEYCGRELSPGVPIMGKAAEYEEPATRKLRVVNNNMEIANMSTIDCSLPTFVYMEPKLYHMILEARGGRFANGSCDGRRTMSNGARLDLPVSLDTSLLLSEGFHVRVVGGWSRSYKEGVKLLHPVYFNCSNYIVDESHDSADSRISTNEL